MSFSSRKRLSGEVLVDVQRLGASRLDLDCKDQQKHKRTCAGVGQLSAEDVASFMHQLTPQLANLPGPEALKIHTGFDQAQWQSFAELNVLLGQHYHKLQASMLRGYHSFCTQDRASLWLNYSKYYSVSEAAAKAPAPAAYDQYAGHLQLVRFLLEWVVSSDACITEYVVSLPSWMVGFAARWGFWGWGQQGDVPTIKLLVLQAYKPVDPGCSRTSSSRQAAGRIFVPLLPKV